jgi:pyruvate/2-oxoglutarate dehydrogenase complex dihydrolipoamide acyltransferase (E2) component
MYQFRLPDLGEGITEGEVVEWLVQEGHAVDNDQPLVEVITDKATVEIPSPVSGTVSAIRVPAGVTVPVGTVLIEIDTGVDARRHEPETAQHSEVLALPAVRRLARELGVDLSTVTPSGPGGRTTDEDVRRAASGKAATEVPAAAAADGVPLRGVRREIARRLRTAVAVPTVTNVDAADFSAVHAAGISPLVATSHACIKALVEHPHMNQWLVEGERLVSHDRVHLGIATQTEAGLVVPVIHDADRMSIKELAASITRVAEAARTGALAPDQLRGSTFTITSAGRLAGMFATPLLNIPEVAIAGLYRIEDRAVVRDGEIVARPVANLSITFDHRALDGRDAAEFLARVIELIQTWPSA